jgi:hypothetical protein
VVRLRDIRAIGRALGAGYLVEGSVRRAGNQVRITAQLINAENGMHMWAERYDRPIEDVFAVQDEIARGIVATVAARVLEQGERVARRKRPESVQAYDPFLQAFAFLMIFHRRFKNVCESYTNEPADSILVSRAHTQAWRSGIWAARSTRSAFRFKRTRTAPRRVVSRKLIT